MGWSAGTFTRSIGTWVASKATTPKITTTKHDENDGDLATGINACLHKGGQNSPSADISWGNNKITGLKDGTSAQDAVSKAQLDAVSGAMLKKDGSVTSTANQPMGGFAHTGVGAATARTQYPSVAQIQSGSLRFAIAGGTANALTLAIAPAIPAYVDGAMFVFRAGAANTGAATMDINSLGAIPILNSLNNAQLSGGEIRAGTAHVLVCDGSNLFLVNPSSVWTSFVPSEAGWSSMALNVGRYRLDGKMCTVVYRASGTADAATTTLTLPFAAATVTDTRWCGVGTGVLGTTETGVKGLIDSAGTVVTFNRVEVNFGDNAMPSTGAKALLVTITYEIA